MAEPNEPTVRLPEMVIPSTGRQPEQSQNTNGIQSPYSPQFISTNRLREIMTSDPRISQSREAQEFLLREMVNRGDEIEGLNAKFSLGEAAANIPESARELAGAMVHLFTTNPLTTVKGISQVALGGLQKIVPGAQNSEAAFDVLADAMVERYGSFERIANTAEKDPVGFAGDLASILTGGAGLVKGAATAGVKASMLSARTAASLTRTAETLTRAANIVDPISVAVGLAKQPIRAIRKANEATGVTKILKDADVNEQMLQGLGLTGTQRVKLAEGTKVAKVGEQLAKMGVTGTLDEMSERLGQISEKTEQAYQNTLKRLDKPTPPPTQVPTRTPPEIDADILKRTEELETQGATAEQLANDPVLQKLDQESLQSYSRNAKSLQPTTHKVNAADKALDQIYDLRKSGTEKLADLVKPANERIVQDLGLTAQETYRIANKTQTRADDIGRRLVGFGIEPDDTMSNISKKLAGAAKESQSELDTALAGVKTRFSTQLNEKVLNNLSRLKKGIPFKDLAKPIQDEYNRVVQLLVKNKNNGLDLSEMNEVKRMIDNMAGDKVFTQAGDIKTSNIGKNLSTLRKELRSLIEKRASENGIKNVRGLNNQTQFAQEVKSIVDKKIKSGLPKEPKVPKEAFTSVEFQALRNELLDLRKKSVENGLSLRELDRVDRLIVEIGGTAKGGAKMNLDNLQKNIRQVVDTQAKRRGVDNFEKLRSQKQFSDAVKQTIDKKILAGGDKMIRADLGKLATQTLFSELLYRSKLGKAYGLFKGARGFFQTVRGPQFHRDMATAIKMLNDKDFAKLEGGFDIARQPTKLETKFSKRAAREKAVNEHVEVFNRVLKDLSKAYPALRGIRLTGEALKNVEQAEAKNKTVAELESEPIVQSSKLAPQQVGLTGSEFEEAGETVELGGQK